MAYNNQWQSRDKGNSYTKGNNGKGKSEGSTTRKSLPIGYLTNGYKDNTGVMEISLITNTAEQIGTALGEDGKTGASKIRSFYDEVTQILAGCTYGDAKWTSARNRVAMLKARANTRFEKGTASKLFLDFISKNVETVIKAKSEVEFKENLRDFKDHFEAVICYLPKK